MIYTYIIKTNDLYKIGKAKNVESRLHSFKCGNPYIEHVKTIDGNYEAYLHKHYKDKRITGEWFRLTEEDIANIDQIVASAGEREDRFPGPLKYKDEDILGCPCERDYYISHLMLKATDVMDRQYDIANTETFDHEVWYKGEILGGCNSWATKKRVIKLENAEDGWPVIVSNEIVNTILDSRVK